MAVTLKPLLPMTCNALLMKFPPSCRSETNTPNENVHFDLVKPVKVEQNNSVQKNIHTAFSNPRLIEGHVLHSSQIG